MLHVVNFMTFARRFQSFCFWRRLKDKEDSYIECWRTLIIVFPKLESGISRSALYSHLASSFKPRQCWRRSIYELDNEQCKPRKMMDREFYKFSKPISQFQRRSMKKTRFRIETVDQTKWWTESSYPGHRLHLFTNLWIKTDLQQVS